MHTLETAMAAASEAAKGKVSLPLGEYIKLLDGTHDSGPTIQPPPLQYLVSHMVLRGNADEGRVQFEIAMEIDILNDASYVTVPLLDRGVTLTRAVITYAAAMGSTQIGHDSDGDGDDDSEMGMDDETGGASISLYNGKYTFISRPQCAGRYSVVLFVETGYHTLHNNSVTLATPKATRGELEFTVPRSDVTVSCDATLTSLQQSQNGVTTLRCSLPPLNRVFVQWQVDEGPRRRKRKEKESAEDEAAAEAAEAAAKAAAKAAAPPVPEEDPMVVANQYMTALIGEGMLSLTAVINFALVNVRRDGFQVRIPADLHLLDVSDPQSVIRSWDVVSVEEATGQAPRGSSDQMVLRVALTYPVEKSFGMRIVAEQTLESTSCALQIPNLRCREVAREKGWVGIGAKTNVEIRETERRGRGLSKIDASELPSDVTSQTNRPLVLCYKYLHTGYTLGMQVTKHADVEVLVAVVDEALVKCIVTAEGKRLYHIKMNVRNTERQFLRLSIAEGAQVWSTEVAGNPVKPAMDPENRLMIPLQKTTSSAIVVSFAYLDPNGDALVDSGNARVPIPVIDLPVSHLFVRVLLPSCTRFKYQDPDEAFPHAKNGFSKQPYFAASSPARRNARPPQRQSNRRNRVQFNANRMQRRTSITLCESSMSFSDSDSCSSEVDDDDEDFNDDFEPEGKPTGAGVGAADGDDFASMSAGLLPVAVSLPPLASEYSLAFERLLLSSDEQLPVISVPYRRLNVV